MQKRRTKKVGGNLHCILAFERMDFEGVGEELDKKMESDDVSHVIPTSEIEDSDDSLESD